MACPGGDPGQLPFRSIRSRNECRKVSDAGRRENRIEVQRSPETPLEYQQSANAGPMARLLDDLTNAVNEGAYAGRWPEPKRVRELADRLS